MRYRFAIAGILSSIMFASGCASNAPVVSSAPIQELKSPEWVKKGSGAFGENKDKVFYGVASAANIKNSSLLRATADNRARNEVAKTFQFYTESLMKDYAASTSTEQPDKVSEEQQVGQAVKTVTSMTLSGVEIVDHWQNPATGEFYALAKLDLEKFKGVMEKQKGLDSETKDYIRKNADRLHSEMGDEVKALR